MIFYIIFIISIVLVLFFVKREKSGLSDIILLTILIAVSGLRYGIGLDYILYQEIYLKMNLIDYSLFRTGLGYYYLSLLFFNFFPKTISPLIFMISFFTNVGVYKFCRKNSVNVGFSIFIYICLGFYTTSFNIFRQMLACSLVWMGYSYLDEKKYIRYIFISIFAILIHQVSLLPIIIIIIFKKIYKKKLKINFIITFGIIMLVTYNYIYQFILNNVTSLGIYNNENNYLPGIGTYIQVFFYVLVYIFININSKKLIANNNKNIVLLNIYSISFIFLMLSINNILFMRVNLYFNIILILLIPELCNLYKIKNLNKLCVYIIFILYFFIYTYSFGGVVPYRSIFNKL